MEQQASNTPARVTTTCALLPVTLQREVRLREREQALMAERTALLEQQSIHAARDEALETLQLKYHLAVCKIKE